MLALSVPTSRAAMALVCAQVVLVVRIVLLISCPTKTHHGGTDWAPRRLRVPVKARAQVI